MGRGGSIHFKKSGEGRRGGTRLNSYLRRSSNETALSRTKHLQVTMKRIGIV